MDTSGSQDEYYNSDLDESFSFTGYDFNAHELSGAEAGDDDDDDEESYIEIELEQSPTKDDGGGDLKLRVSFSSSRVPLKELFVDHYHHQSSDTSSSSSLSSKGNNRMRRMQFSAINRVFNAFVSSFRVPPPSAAEETGRNDGNRRLDGRKSSSKVTTAINGGMTKIMIKFRAIKIRPPPVLTSFVKPRRVKGNIVNSQEMSRRKRTKGSIGLDINMEAIRGVLEAINNRMRMKTKTKMETEPMNEREMSRGGGGYSRENSLQAAIAHCKRSFG